MARLRACGEFAKEMLPLEDPKTRGRILLGPSKCVNPGAGGSGATLQAQGMSRRLWHSGLWVACLTLLSRLLGFVRDAVLASALGAGPMAEAFVLAFRLPNLARRMVAEGMLAQGLVPILVRLQVNQGRAAVERRLWLWLGYALVFACVLLLSATWWLPHWLLLLAPGYGAHGEPADLALRWGTLMLPFLALSAVAAVFGAGLQARHQVAWLSSAPILLNLTLLTAMALAWTWPVHVRIDAIALAVSVAAGLQITLLAWAWWAGRASVSLAPVDRTAEHPERADFDPTDEDLAAGSPGWLAALFATSVSQVNVLVATAMASVVAPGSLAYLFYADRLVEFPQALVASALAMVLLPRLAEARATGNQADYGLALENALVVTVLVALPASLGLWAASESITAALFLYGQMLPEDGVAAATAVRAYAPALLPLCLGRILLTSLLTAERGASVWTYAVIGLIVHALSAWVLGQWLGFSGIALASAWASVAQVAYAMRVLPAPAQGMWARIAPAFAAISLASGAMLVVVFMLRPDMATFLTYSPHGRGLVLAGLISMAGLVYVSALFSLRPQHPGLRWLRLERWVSRA